VPRTHIDPTTGRVHVVRNHDRINAYNAFVIACLRCNMDIKVIQSVADARSIGYYITTINKYITKVGPQGEHNLAVLWRLFQDEIKRGVLDPAKRASTLLQRMVNQTAGKEEIGYCMIHRVLVGWDICYKSHDYVTLHVPSLLRWQRETRARDLKEMDKLGLSASQLEAEAANDDADDLEEVQVIRDFKTKKVHLHNFPQSYVNRSEQLKHLSPWDMLRLFHEVKISRREKQRSRYGSENRGRLAEFDFFEKHPLYHLFRLVERMEQRIPAPVWDHIPSPNTEMELWSEMTMTLWGVWRSGSDLCPPNSTFREVFPNWLEQQPHNVKLRVARFHCLADRKPSPVDAFKIKRMLAAGKEEAGKRKKSRRSQECCSDSDDEGFGLDGLRYTMDALLNDDRFGIDELPPLDLPVHDLFAFNDSGMLPNKKNWWHRALELYDRVLQSGPSKASDEATNKQHQNAKQLSDGKMDVDDGDHDEQPGSALGYHIGDDHLDQKRCKDWAKELEAQRDAERLRRNQDTSPDLQDSKSDKDEKRKGSSKRPPVQPNLSVMALDQLLSDLSLAKVDAETNLELLQVCHQIIELADAAEKTRLCKKIAVAVSQRYHLSLEQAIVFFTGAKRLFQELVDPMVSSCVDRAKRRRQLAERWWAFDMSGLGGTGKSLVIHSLQELASLWGMPYAVCTGTPSGVSANVAHGETLHSMFCCYDGSNVSDKRKEMYERIVILIIDELSMVGCYLLGRVSRAVRQIIDGHPELPFGGCCVFFSGDPHQLDPVNDKSLYKPLWQIANFTEEEQTQIAQAAGPPSHEHPKRQLSGDGKPQRPPPLPAAAKGKSRGKASGKGSAKGKKSARQKDEDEPEDPDDSKADEKQTKHKRLSLPKISMNMIKYEGWNAYDSVTLAMSLKTSHRSATDPELTSLSRDLTIMYKDICQEHVDLLNGRVVTDDEVLAASTGRPLCRDCAHATLLCCINDAREYLNFQRVMLDARERGVAVFLFVAEDQWQIITSAGEVQDLNVLPDDDDAEAKTDGDAPAAAAAVAASGKDEKQSGVSSAQSKGKSKPQSKSKAAPNAMPKAQSEKSASKAKASAKAKAKGKAKSAKGRRGRTVHSSTPYNLSTEESRELRRHFWQLPEADLNNYSGKLLLHEGQTVQFRENTAPNLGIYNTSTAIVEKIFLDPREKVHNLQPGTIHKCVYPLTKVQLRVIGSKHTALNGLPPERICIRRTVTTINRSTLSKKKHHEYTFKCGQHRKISIQSFSRAQLHLTTAYAITTWNAQGTTIDGKILLDLRKPFGMGGRKWRRIVFVNISRAKRLEQIALLRPITLEDLGEKWHDDILDHKEHMMKLEEETMAYGTRCALEFGAQLPAAIPPMPSVITARARKKAADRAAAYSARSSAPTSASKPSSHQSAANPRPPAPPQMLPPAPPQAPPPGPPPQPPKAVLPPCGRADCTGCMECGAMEHVGLWSPAARPPVPPQPAAAQPQAATPQSAPSSTDDPQRRTGPLHPDHSWIREFKLLEEDYNAIWNKRMLNTTHIDAIHAIAAENNPRGLDGMQPALRFAAAGMEYCPFEGLQMHHTGTKHFVTSTSIGARDADDVVVAVFDSLYTEPNPKLCEQLVHTYKRPRDLYVLVCWMPWQKQSNFVDCALYAAAAFIELFRSDAQRPLTVAAMHFDEKKMRPHMSAILESKKLTPFPKASTPQPRVQPHPTWFVLDQHAKHFGPYQTKEGALQAANMIAMVG
jgi:hypothetical protein